jgi:uncharacterized protein (DUF58 family)
MMASERQAARHDLLSPEFLRKLDALDLLARKLVAGSVGGARRARAHGSSLEFSDYRTYVPGDDYRRIDWSVYARLERLFLRLFHAEESLTVSLFLDCSSSMNFGTPAKFRLAQQIAAALVYVSLGSTDRVAVAAGHDRVEAYLPPVSGRSSVWRAWDFLTRLHPGGATDLNRGLEQLAQRLTGRGVVVVLSDLFARDGYQACHNRILASGSDLHILQILAREEIEPDDSGDWELIDSEGGPTVSVSLRAAVREEYRRRFASFTAEASAFCHRHGAQFLQLPSDVSIDDVVLRLLRRARVLE